jgi:acyl carrier protein
MTEQVENVNVKDQIREFVREAAQRKGVSEVTDDQSLVESGVIDSLGIFRLVAFLEESFRVRIGDEEIVGENFESIAGIERFVLNKLNR